MFANWARYGVAIAIDPDGGEYAECFIHVTYDWN
jgi:hypothetical protein